MLKYSCSPQTHLKGCFVYLYIVIVWSMSDVVHDTKHDDSRKKKKQSLLVWFKSLNSFKQFAVLGLIWSALNAPFKSCSRACKHCMDTCIHQTLYFKLGDIIWTVYIFQHTIFYTNVYPIIQNWTWFSLVL